MVRSWQGCILILALFAASTAWAQHPLLKIYVYDDVRVPPHVLLGAEDSSRRIFRQSGVQTLWIDCSPRSVPAEPCGGSFSPETIVVRIVHDNDSHNIGREAFGAAFLGTGGDGRYTTVFFDRANQLHQQCAVNLAELLGHVIAHEIGHVLLGLQAHTPFGVMRAVWYPEELQQAERGRLLFTSVQSKRMREKLMVMTGAGHSELAGGE